MKHISNPTPPIETQNILMLQQAIRKANTVFYIFFFVALRPNAGQGLLILEVSGSHKTTHHSQ